MPALLLLLLCVVPAPAPASSASTPASAWETVAPGVELAEFEAPLKSQIGDSRVTVRLLLLHARSPYRTHDFVQIALKLPIGLKRMMYLEGGPEASLHVSAPGKTVRRFGSFETGFNENDSNDRYWGLPNVIGVMAPDKQEAPPASAP